LGRTVRELEETLGAGELAEWLCLLNMEPWGPYRTDSLSMAGWVYSMMAPNSEDPGSVLKRMKLPWDRRKPETIRTVSKAEMIAALKSWGGREVN
jgi:hypothetical protein